MDTQMEKVYDDLLSRRMNNPGYAQIVQLIRDAANVHMPLSLRADALYFLANNIYDLVEEPIYTARAARIALREGTLPTDQDFRTSVASDVSIILGSSAQAARTRGRNYISAASAVVGCAAVIDSIKINEWHLWGP
jgi:hypothetical protein